MTPSLRLSSFKHRWQGHVAFFLRAVGQQVEVLGGNQGNGVSVTRYPKSKVLGIRRAIGFRSGVIGVAGVAASAIAPAVETAERAKDVTERSAALLNLTEWLSPLLPWAGALIFLVVIMLAFRARTARIEDYRTGRTP